MTRWLPRLESATTRPPAGMSGAASWARRRSGRALVESTQSHCFADSSRPSLSTPEAALLTRMSSRPATRSTSAINRLISAGSFRSARTRSEEHTSELQSQSNIVCRLLLEKKKKQKHNINKLIKDFILSGDILYRHLAMLLWSRSVRL